MVRRQQYHAVANTAASAIENEEPVLVYDSPEFQQLAKISTAGNFGMNIGSTDHKSKVYSMLPFLVESAWTSKSFVLRMQIYPKSALLQFDTLQFGGVETFYVPVN